MFSGLKIFKPVPISLFSVISFVIHNCDHGVILGP